MVEAVPERRVTAADVARSVGVSRATVGFVMNRTPGQTISEATRRKVLDEAERLGYRPHRAAQDLRRGHSKLILLVLPDWPIDFSMRRHLEEAALALDEAGYSLVTYTRHAADRTRPLWELLSPEVVLGYLPFDEDDVASMRACGITKIVPDPAAPIASADSPALTSGPALQVRHLYELGHRRLAFAAAADPRVSFLVDARVRTARKAADRLGMADLDVRPVDHRDGSADRAVRRWRDTGITAVVAYNDDTAAATVGAALRAGLAVPGDLAVVGHDDSPIAAMFVPAISSVRLDDADLGRRFAGEALHAADGRARPAADSGVEATLVARESTGPVVDQVY